MVEVFFGSTWKNKKASGLSVRFPFTVLVTSLVAEKDKKYENSINVMITNVQLARWEYKEDEIEKILFEFALRELKSKMSLEQLTNEQLDILLTSDNQPKEQPFDSNKIPNPNGYCLTLDEKKLRTKKTGF